jgi:hypothetical protein
MEIWIKFNDEEIGPFDSSSLLVFLESNNISLNAYIWTCEEDGYINIYSLIEKSIGETVWIRNDLNDELSLSKKEFLDKSIKGDISTNHEIWIEENDNYIKLSEYLLEAYKQEYLYMDVNYLLQWAIDEKALILGEEKTRRFRIGTEILGNYLTTAIEQCALKPKFNFETEVPLVLLTNDAAGILTRAEMILVTNLGLHIGVFENDKVKKSFYSYKQIKSLTFNGGIINNSFIINNYTKREIDLQTDFSKKNKPLALLFIKIVNYLKKTDLTSLNKFYASRISQYKIQGYRSLRLGYAYRDFYKIDSVIGFRETVTFLQAFMLEETDMLDVLFNFDESHDRDTGIIAITNKRLIIHTINENTSFTWDVITSAESNQDHLNITVSSDLNNLPIKGVSYASNDSDTVISLLMGNERKIQFLSELKKKLPKPNVSTTPQKTTSGADEISKLFSLFKEGAITEEEYNIEKVRLLGKSD